MYGDIGDAIDDDDDDDQEKDGDIDDMYGDVKSDTLVNNSDEDEIKNINGNLNSNLEQTNSSGGAVSTSSSPVPIGKSEIGNVHVL